MEGFSYEDQELLLESLLEEQDIELSEDEILTEGIYEAGQKALKFVDSGAHKIKVKEARRLFGSYSDDMLRRLIKYNEDEIKKHESRIKKDNEHVVFKWIKKGARTALCIGFPPATGIVALTSPYRMLKVCLASKNAAEMMLEERAQRPDNWSELSHRQQKKLDKQIRKDQEAARKEAKRIEKEEAKIRMEPSELEKLMESGGDIMEDKFEELIALEESIEMEREAFVFAEENTITVEEALIFEDGEDFVVLEADESLFDHPEILEEGVKEVVKRGKDAAKGAIEKVVVAIDEADKKYLKSLYYHMSDKNLEKALAQNMKAKAKAEAAIKKDKAHPVVKFVRKGAKLGVILVFPPAAGTLINMEPVNQLKVAVKCINAINAVKEARKHDPDYIAEKEENERQERAKAEKKEAKAAAKAAKKEEKEAKKAAKKAEKEEKEAKKAEKAVSESFEELELNDAMDSLRESFEMDLFDDEE